VRLKFGVVLNALGSVVDVSSHPASSLFDRRPVVFTAHSAESAYLRERICAFVLNEGFEWSRKHRTSYENVAGQGVTARGSVRRPVRMSAAPPGGSDSP
jgi:hypothetical protein